MKTRKSRPDLYAVDGVNIKAGDSFSAICGEICRSTYELSPWVTVEDMSQGHFRGPRGFRFKSDGTTFQMGAADGIGTKVILIDSAGVHLEGAANLIAMTFGDITRYGGLPLVFMNVLDASSIGELVTKRFSSFVHLMKGLGDLAHVHKFVLLGGETAELGVCVGSENPEATTKFNWAGFALGIGRQDRMITGEGLRPGQIVIALREHGFRSNGISAVRKALALKFGHEWYYNGEASKAINAAAAPSIIYDTFLATANGWDKWGRYIPMHYIAHLSGGAIQSKFGEDGLFPRGLSADLPKLWTPPRIMRDCARWRGFNDEDCYTTWNGGQGALVVVDEKDQHRFIALAKGFGIGAKPAGTIVRRRKPSIRIKSQFTGKTFELNPD
ncbi:MAG: AIR synthase-related protein [Candidatus Taylorbacteria bacterium]